jgi:hypothetical protein
MAFVTLHIAIDGNGHGAIGLTKDAVIAAVGDTPRIAVASVPCWGLSAAMIHGWTIPIRFALERDGGALPGNLRREVRRW